MVSSTVTQAIGLHANISHSLFFFSERRSHLAKLGTKVFFNLLILFGRDFQVLSDECCEVWPREGEGRISLTDRVSTAGHTREETT